jgi:hypothetical protein
MENMMVRLLLFACFGLATILLFQSDFAATGHQAQMNTRLARDDSGNAQSTEPSTTSDTGGGDDPGKPDQDQ